MSGNTLEYYHSLMLRGWQNVRVYKPPRSHLYTSFNLYPITIIKLIMSIALSMSSVNLLNPLNYYQFIIWIIGGVMRTLEIMSSWSEVKVAFRIPEFVGSVWSEGSLMEGCTHRLWSWSPSDSINHTEFKMKSIIKNEEGHNIFVK